MPLSCGQKRIHRSGCGLRPVVVGGHPRGARGRGNLIDEVAVVAQGRRSGDQDPVDHRVDVASPQADIPEEPIVQPHKIADGSTRRRCPRTILRHAERPMSPAIVTASRTSCARPTAACRESFANICERSWRVRRRYLSSSGVLMDQWSMIGPSVLAVSADSPHGRLVSGRGLRAVIVDCLLARVSRCR